MSRRASGLRAWAIQRISALYLLVFTLYLLGYFIFTPPATYEQWRDWVVEPIVSIAIMLFVLSLLVHAWIGIRDVLIDYVHPMTARLSLLTLFAFGLFACGFWAVKILMLAQTP